MQSKLQLCNGFGIMGIASTWATSLTTPLDHPILTTLLDLTTLLLDNPA